MGHERSLASARKRSTVRVQIRCPSEIISGARSVPCLWGLWSNCSVGQWEARRRTFSPMRLRLSSLRSISPLLDLLTDVVFFVKDLQARYLFANRTLVLRCGFKLSEELLNQTAEEVGPPHLGSLYTQQDLQVLNSGIDLEDQLELHLYFGNLPIWCLTRKIVLRNAGGKIIALAGLSRDLPSSQINHPAFDKLAAVDSYICANFARSIALSELTHLSGFSVAQLERLCKQIFQLTPRQLIHKARLTEASRLLQQKHLPITEVALQCGYTDHSAFSRKFRAMTNLSPSDYRNCFE